MDNSGFVTGQYVRIKPTVASVGDRIFAQLIDWGILLSYIISVVWLGSKANIRSEWYYIILVGFVPLFYTLLCEIFNQGRSLGKMAMKMQVVKKDGTSATLGAYIMRWLLFIVDGPMFSFLGLIAIAVTRDHQRLGDMAAGTVVVKHQKYKNIQISLDEFDYLSHNYTPCYPQAADLSLEQVEIITRTLSVGSSDFASRVAVLAGKVREKLNVERKETDDAAFLRRIVRDYQYFALEEI